MTEDNRLSKVEILIQQKKFGEAEKLLSDLLTRGFKQHSLSIFDGRGISATR